MNKQAVAKELVNLARQLLDCDDTPKGCLEVIGKEREINGRRKAKGRPRNTAKRQHIISLALANETLSMKRIAEHVGCSEALVASVFNDRKSWDK